MPLYLIACNIHDIYDRFQALIQEDEIIALHKETADSESRLSKGADTYAPQAYVDSRSRRVIGTRMNADLMHRNWYKSKHSTSIVPVAAPGFARMRAWI